MGWLDYTLGRGIARPEGYSCTAIWVRNHSKDGLNSTGDVGYHSELPYAVAGVNEAYGASILGIYFGYFGLDILYN